MNKSMVDVLKEHDAPMRERLAGLGRRARDCRCGLIVYVPEAEDTKEAFAEHQAAMLKEAGFGSQHDAWERGASDAIEREYTQGAESKAAFNNPYPETSTS